MSEPRFIDPSAIREKLKEIEDSDPALVERVMRHVQPFKVGDRVREVETIAVSYNENVPEPYPVASSRRGHVFEKHGALHVMWDGRFGAVEPLDRNNTEILDPVEALAELADEGR